MHSSVMRSGLADEGVRQDGWHAEEIEVWERLSQARELPESGIRFLQIDR
jgi:hypothetical protein